MAYIKPNYTGIDRFLNNVATSETPQSTLLMNGQKMEGNMGLARLGHGIAKLLMSGKNQENAQNYGIEQQNALASGNIEEASGNAAAAGDMENAVKLAAAANDAKQRNAMLGIERAKLNATQSEKLLEAQKKAQADALARSAALKAVATLDELGTSGKINAMNKASDNWFLTGKSSENIGKRTAALASLLPFTNMAARASGGSGINTVGEMMAYLGIPENATSEQIKGALPGLKTKLGMTDAELASVMGNVPATKSTFKVVKAE